MSKKLLTLLCIVASVMLLACERTSRDLAVKPKSAGGPEYAVQTGNPATTVGLVNVAAVAPAGKGPNGQKLFAENCAVCHQATGAGVPTVFPPLDASAYVTGDKTDRLASILLYGLTGPITVNGTVYNNNMVAFGGRFSDEELAAVATYIRGAWSNKAAAVEPAVFAAARKKWGDRAQFQISELGEEK